MAASDVGPREKSKTSQTLVPLLRGLIGKVAVIELKNELRALGKVEWVDCFMNISMKDVKMSCPKGRVSLFSMFFIPRKSVRSIQLPPRMNIQNTLKEQVDIVTGEKGRRERQKAKKKKANYLKKKAAKTTST